MRVLSIVVATGVFCSLAEARAQDVEAAVKAYAAHVDQISQQLLFAEFAKHSNRVHHIAFTFSLLINAQGRPLDVKIASRIHDAFIEDIARRTLSVAKFPPIPKNVVQALGETLAIQGNINAFVSR
jgi:hypothetical protein